MSKLLASRKTGVPQTVNAIRKGGGFITQKIPPLDKWGFFLQPWVHYQKD